MNTNTLCHTRNVQGELSMWTNPTACPCSTCIDYCQEKGLINTTVTGGGASTAPSAAPPGLAPAPSEHGSPPMPPMPPMMPVLERQNAVTLNFPAMDNQMDILNLEGMIYRWRRRIGVLEGAMDSINTGPISAEINSLLNRIVQAENVIDLIRSFHSRNVNVTNADNRSQNN